jgi:hypothetical protein
MIILTIISNVLNLGNLQTLHVYSWQCAYNIMAVFYTSMTFCCVLAHSGMTCHMADESASRDVGSQEDMK